MSTVGALWIVGFLGSIALLSLGGCKKPIAEAPPEPLPEVAPTTPAPATPAPASPPPQVVTATPAPNYLAPEGVFFLIAKVSIQAADGITGLRPGTELRQISPMEYTAPEGHKVTLRPDQVTNDLRIVRQVASADAAAQNALLQRQTPRASTARVTAPATPTPPPRAAVNNPPPTRPSGNLGSSGALGSTHTRVKDGFIWEMDRNGMWRRLRPVRP